MPVNTFVFIFFLFLGSFYFSSCSVLIGNIQPLEKKSSEYQILNLSEKNSDWITSLPKDKTTSLVDTPDLTYQSKKTASQISINSVCQSDPSSDLGSSPLTTLSKQLLLGVSHISDKTQEEKSMNGTTALQTTLNGFLDKEKIKIRTLVFTKNSCVYDLILVAPPHLFETHLSDFNDFSSSLKWISR